jgi:transposase-like protein
LPLHADSNWVEFCMPQRWQGWDPPRGPGGWEPIKSWRNFSRQAGALLRLAARLHRDRVGQNEDISTVISTTPQSLKRLYPAVFEQPGETVDQQRAFVAACIREWLWLGSVRLDFKWYGHGARIEFGGFGLHYGLFGALAVQLILAIGGSDGVVFCSGCGKAYLPKRRPKSRQRNYCADCGRRAALRDAATAYRRRCARARDLDRAGVPFREIVRRVHGDSKRVREWIRSRPRKKVFRRS